VDIDLADKIRQKSGPCKRQIIPDDPSILSWSNPTLNRVPSATIDNDQGRIGGDPQLRGQRLPVIEHLIRRVLRVKKKPISFLLSSAFIASN